MPEKKSKDEIELKLAEQVTELAKQIKNLKEMETIQVFKHPWKMMWLGLLKGLMVGFGSVLGATVLVALFIYVLAQIKVVPIVGDFIEDIIQEVQNTTNIKSSNNTTTDYGTLFVPDRNPAPSTETP